MGLKHKTEVHAPVHCKFDIRNHVNTCLLDAHPCKYKGKEDKCPLLQKEKSKEQGTYGDFKFSWHRM